MKTKYIIRKFVGLGLMLLPLAVISQLLGMIVNRGMVFGFTLLLFATSVIVLLVCIVGLLLLSIEIGQRLWKGQKL